MRPGADEVWMMDVVGLSRLLFAATAGVHYLFVATTLGLAPIIAVLSTRVAVRRHQPSEQLLDVLGRVYLANYGIGIVTGLVMELQMAMLWTGPGATEYDPIAAMLALETVLAFFLESVLLGLWIAGAGVVPAWVRAVLFWGVAATAYASATFIVGANSQLHAPLDLSGPFGWPEVTAMIGRAAAVTPLLHVTTSSLVIGGFWLAAIAARWLRAGGDRRVARSALRGGFALVAVAAPVAVASGLAQFPVVRPGLPDDSAGAFGVALAVMMLVGLLITVITWVLLPLVLTDRLLTGHVLERRWSWPILSAGVGIPLATTFLGWLYREEARQPWFIVGRVTVAEAARPLPSWQLVVLSVFFVGLVVLAAGCGWVVMGRVAAPSSERIPDPAEQSLRLSGD